MVGETKRLSWYLTSSENMLLLKTLTHFEFDHEGFTSITVEPSHYLRGKILLVRSFPVPEDCFSPTEES
jgi:hypothetical protein